MYIKPSIKLIELDSKILTSSSNKKHPGWGPDKNSDDDGHTIPPGQRKDCELKPYFYKDY